MLVFWVAQCHHGVLITGRQEGCIRKDKATELGWRDNLGRWRRAWETRSVGGLSKLEKVRKQILPGASRKNSAQPKP